MRGSDALDITGPPEPIEPPVAADAIAPLRTDLRRRAARGTLINGAFLVALTALGLVRGFVLARFLTTDDYGIWAILVTSFGTLVFLKEVGVSDKYIQQADLDQETAFQRAFTIEVIMTGAVTALIAVVIPLVAWAYGRWELVPVGLVGLIAVPALALQAPLWIWYRRMDYFKQRLLGAADPIVGFVVAVGLAVAGAGYWALVGGPARGHLRDLRSLAVVTSPYPLRLRYDGTVLQRVPAVLAAAARGLGGGARRRPGLDHRRPRRRSGSRARAWSRWPRRSCSSPTASTSSSPARCTRRSAGWPTAPRCSSSPS